MPRCIQGPKTLDIHHSIWDGGKVTRSVRQLTLQLQASFGPIERLRTVRCRIYRLG